MSELYLDILNQIQEGIYCVDTERKIIFWNTSAEKISGFSSEEMIGKHCFESGLDHIDKMGKQLCVLGCPLTISMNDRKAHQEQVFLRHKLGHRVPVYVRSFPLVKENQIVGAIEMFSRNSVKVFKDDLIGQLQTVATHDELTQLPNRRFLQDYLSHKFDDYSRFQRPFALLFADIDDFSKVNNEYGHDVGDLVLKKVTNILKCATRTNDVIGRWGGEEFVGIYNVTNLEDCKKIGQRVIVLVDNTWVQRKIHVTISVGMTLVRPEDTIDSILERADDLMYKSKQNGKNQAHYSL